MHLLWSDVLYCCGDRDRVEDIYIVTVDKREICFNFLFSNYNCLIFN